MALSLNDIQEIKEILSRFAFIHDDRRFELYHLIYTPDAMLDTLYVGGAGLQTLEEHLDILRGMLAKGVRADHHTMNTIVIEDDNGDARARSRYITHWDDGRICNGDYLDILRRTPDGWRISLRKTCRRLPLEFGTPPAEFFQGWPCA